MRHLILFENYINENNFYTFGDILKRKHINDNKENVIDDFKVGYKVLPSKWYKNMDEIRDKYAHVIKLDNNFVYVKNTLTGVEYKYSPKDLLLISDQHAN
jgi:hypothetical protein